MWWWWWGGLPDQDQKLQFARGCWTKACVTAHRNVTNGKEKKRERKGFCAFLKNNNKKTKLLTPPARCMWSNHPPHPRTHTRTHTYTTQLGPFHRTKAVHVGLCRNKEMEEAPLVAAPVLFFPPKGFNKQITGCREGRRRRAGGGGGGLGR